MAKFTKNFIRQARKEIDGKRAKANGMMVEAKGLLEQADALEKTLGDQAFDDVAVVSAAVVDVPAAEPVQAPAHDVGVVADATPRQVFDEE